MIDTIGLILGTRTRPQHLSIHLGSRHSVRQPGTETVFQSRREQALKAQSGSRAPGNSRHMPWSP